MVAVTKQGDFFVADGYCNSRIIRFSPEGRYISHIGSENYSPFGSINPAPEEFFIPHDIKLSSDENTLFVADRENGRIQAFDAKNGKFLRLIHLPEFGFKLFALDLTGKLDWYHGLWTKMAAFNRSFRVIFNGPTKIRDLSLLRSFWMEGFCMKKTFLRGLLMTNELLTIYFSGSYG